MAYVPTGKLPTCNRTDVLWRDMYEAGKSLRSIAAEFGVTHHAVKDGVIRAGGVIQWARDRGNPNWPRRENEPGGLPRIL